LAIWLASFATRTAFPLPCVRSGPPGAWLASLGAAIAFTGFRTPVVGAPVVGAPVVGAPVVGAPVVGAPIIGAPVVWTPVIGPRIGTAAFGWRFRAPVVRAVIVAPRFGTIFSTAIFIIRLDGPTAQANGQPSSRRNEPAWGLGEKSCAIHIREISFSRLARNPSGGTFDVPAHGLPRPRGKTWKKLLATSGSAIR
jgi:hypothetical protein